jgi:hypothetical protein
MRPDIDTKAVLAVIESILAAIACNSVISPDTTASAQSAPPAGVQFTQAGWAFKAYDTRTGDILGSTTTHQPEGRIFPYSSWEKSAKSDKRLPRMFTTSAAIRGTWNRFGNNGIPAARKFATAQGVNETTGLQACCPDAGRNNICDCFRPTALSTKAGTKQEGNPERLAPSPETFAPAFRPPCPEGSPALPARPGFRHLGPEHSAESKSPEIARYSRRRGLARAPRATGRAFGLARRATLRTADPLAPHHSARTRT